MSPTNTKHIGLGSHNRNGTSRAPCNVLIVDDDIEDIYIVKHLLAQSSDFLFNMTEVSSVDSALEILDMEEFDVIIIDYYIGGRLGTEILEELNVKSSVPVVMLTGQNLTRQDREEVHHGAFDLLDKNELTRSSLIRSIHFAINRSRVKTDLRMTEERLRSVREEVQDLRLACEVADQANRVKSEFLARMSHELRTPLNAILGYSEVIRDDILSDGVGQRYCAYAGAIHSSGHHLLTLIDDLLDLSKIEAGCRTLNIETIDISDILNDATTLLAPVAAKRRIDIIHDLQPGMTSVQADRRALKQVLVNIISNAIKFSHEGGRITLKMRETDGESSITIMDTGIGIPENEIRTALTPFRQTGHPDHAAPNGTGLGLPISKLLVEEHGGTLTLASKQGKGTHVTLRFPKDAAVQAHTIRIVSDDYGRNPASASRSDRKRCRKQASNTAYGLPG